MGTVVIAIIVIGAVIGAVSQVMKKQQEAAPAKRARTRQAAPTRTSQGDIDRFLQEIDRLRKKPAEPAPVASRPKAKVVAAVPTVRQAKPVTSRTEFPPAKPAAPQPVPVVVPVASPITAPAVSKAQAREMSPFGRNLATLLSGPQAVAMGIVLHEVLGPPKCKR